VRGKYMEERASAFPQINASGTIARTFDNSQSKLFASFGGFGTDASGLGDLFGGRQDVRSAQVGVTQPLFTWGQVGAAIRAAQVGFKLADHQLRRFRQAVVKDVSTAFYDVLVAREFARIAEQDLAQKQRHLEETQRRQSAGTATDYDVLAAQVVAENARPSVISAQNLVRVAREQLRFLLAETASEVDVAGTLEAAIEPAPGYDVVLGDALKNRPELGEAASQRGVYAELVTIASAGNKPRIDFSAALGVKNLALKTLGATGYNWNAAVVASVPLFDGDRTKGRVAEAQSDLARATLDELKLRDGISLEVRTAVDAVKEAAEIVTALTGTVKQAERLLFLAEKGFELGVKTRLDVQDAELNALNARANLARAQRNYRVARVNVDWVAGNLDK
jgi:HAE1 family hydrophobic/amphiphilic exporter-1